MKYFKIETNEDFCNKIKVGKDAKVTEDFMIISQLNHLFGHGLNDV